MPQHLPSSAAGELPARTGLPTESEVSRWTWPFGVGEEREDGNPSAHFLEQKSSGGVEICAPPNKHFRTASLTFRKVRGAQNRFPARGVLLHSWVVFLPESSLELMRTSGGVRARLRCEFSTTCADSGVFLALDLSLHI